ncbi:MAG: PKD domain-containing protein [Chloroflexia bacterium]|nr:PKD domain-containing protein [Chloroflexia bacterium]
MKQYNRCPISTCADYTNWPKEVYDGTPNYSFVKQQTGLGTTNGWTRHWDDNAKVPYLTKGSYFLSYDDLQSIEYKANYIKNNQLAGTIVWTVYGDLEFGGTVTNHGVKLKSWSNMSHELIDKVNQVFANTTTNVPPTVSISNPSNNAQFDEGTAITINANAADADGTVTSVKFYVDGTLIATDNSSPYSIQWTNGASGNHNLTAVATDNDGATTTSTGVAVTINGGTQPSDYKILMYVTSWSGNAANYDYSKVTHLNYSFSVPNNDGTVPAPDNATKLQDIVTRAHAAGVKVSLAIGGWLNSSPTNTPFETFSQTATGRANFANACASLIQQYNLDGVDIDWEYPTQTQRWNDLIAAVRQAIGTGKLLTAAVAGGNYFGQGFGSESFVNLDWINIMSYDCSCPTNAPYSYAVEGLDYWTGRGMPINKCVLGVPFYTEDNTPALHTQKAELVKSRGAAGMMAWELANDTDGSQLGAIYDALHGGTGSAPVANANGPYSASSGVAINFSSAGSNDSDGTIVSYSWNFGDSNTSTQANPSHAYAADGTYTVTLTVTDNDGKQEVVQHLL